MSARKLSILPINKQSIYLTLFYKGIYSNQNQNYRLYNKKTPTPLLFKNVAIMLSDNQDL